MVTTNLFVHLGLMICENIKTKQKRGKGEIFDKKGKNKVE
jgi:hypothetical protein